MYTCIPRHTPYTVYVWVAKFIFLPCTYNLEGKAHAGKMAVFNTGAEEEDQKARRGGAAASEEQIGSSRSI